MLKTRKTKHLDFIQERMREIHNEMVRELMHSTIPCMDTLMSKRELLKKYRRRARLMKA